MQKSKKPRKGKKTEDTAKSRDPDVELINVTQSEGNTLGVSESLINKSQMWNKIFNHL